MKLPVTASAASSFAHLLGFGAKATRAQEPEEENEDDEKKLDEENVPDETKPDDQEAEDDENKPDAESADDDADAEDADDEEDEGKDDDPKTKKAKASARRHERTRCATIFRSKAAAARPDLAAHLAFNTGLSAKRARDVLEAAAGGASAVAGVQRTMSNAQLARRMAGVSIPNVGTGTQATTVAQAIVQANNRRLGLK